MILLEFILASLLIELTPGPNMGWLALLAARRGRLHGLAAVGGVAAGLAFAGTAASLGLALIVATTPWLFQLLRWAGAAYLLYLAWEAWRDAEAEMANGTEESPSHYFSQGLISNSLNPKAYLVYAAVLPQFLPDASGSWQDIALLTAIYVVVATLVHAGVVLLAGSASAIFASETRRRKLGRIAAALLILMSVWFLLSTGRAG